jgi:hypothetical protein
MTLKGSTVTVIATSADGFSSEYEVRVSSPLAIAIGATGVAGVGSAVFARKRRKVNNPKGRERPGTLLRPLSFCISFF